MKLVNFLNLLDYYYNNYNIERSIIVVPNDDNLYKINEKLIKKDYSILEINNKNIDNANYYSLNYRIILIKYKYINKIIYILSNLNLLKCFNLILFYNINNTLKNYTYNYIKIISSI
jgi:hypothetical protein